MHSIYSAFLTNYFKPELLEKLKIVQDNYQNSVKLLASIDPLAAYYLSGKVVNIVKGFDTIQNWFNDLQQKFPADATEIDVGAMQFMKIVKPNVIDEALVELEKDIRSIAWKINPYVWVKSILMIKQLKINIDEKFDKEIDQLFNQMTSLFGKNS